MSYGLAIYSQNWYSSRDLAQYANVERRSATFTNGITDDLGGRMG